MLSIGSLAFLTPWLLTALVTLPILWWLLRAIPPAPAKRAFPGVRLLLGLTDPERMPERTPWWLLLLRILALALAVLAFANPVLNPRSADLARGPLLVVLDGSWASAPNWQDRLARTADVLDRAGRNGRTVHLHVLSDPLPPEGLSFRDAASWQQRLEGISPNAWSATRGEFATWLTDQDAEFDTVWISDGLATDGDADFMAALAGRGTVTVVQDARATLGMGAPRFEDGKVLASVLRSRSDVAQAPVTVSAIGLDPNGLERKLGEAQAIFEPDALAAEVEFDLPVELRNRITRISIDGLRSAGAVALSDDGLKRRKIGIVAGRASREEQNLISPLHYLRTALEPSADLIEATLGDILNAAPDVVIFADVGTVAGEDRIRLEDWVEKGGLLLRFAGPRLAQSGEGQLQEDPLLPVRLRAGGRSVGGALSWGAPKTLRPFPESSPFFGLSVPEDVAVTSQVMAQPDPNLPERVMAALEDGTPLVTGRAQGTGRVILFHVTANADWSSLPLSGLFVQMLDRLAVSARSFAPDAEDLEGETWVPISVLDGFGTLSDAGLLAGVDGADLVSNPPSALQPPGLYEAGDRQIASNVISAETELAPLQGLPAGFVQEGFDVAEEFSLKPLMLVLAFGLLMLDVLATLFVSGRLTGPRVVAGGTAALLALALTLPQEASAQDSDALAQLATTQTVLAYVQTGDSRTDQISEAGLIGLTLVLNRRTAIEPVAPVAVDLERDELAFFPFLYWPVTELQEIPSEAAYAKLNMYLRNGGMILFDTRDAHLGGTLGSGTPNGRMLQRLAANLDIPPLEPAPEDHVLTRTFYLLQDFPGRYARTPIWVEAAPDIEEVDGMPFRNLNDGVTPVVMGSNDWAAAWAVDADGRAMFPVGRGSNGSRQRELAYRFGVNLIMHVMTGNYKSDQVHVPALLERLGQ